MDDNRKIIEDIIHDENLLDQEYNKLISLLDEFITSKTKTMQHIEKVQKLNTELLNKEIISNNLKVDQIKQTENQEKQMKQFQNDIQYVIHEKTKVKKELLSVNKFYKTITALILIFILLFLTFLYKKSMGKLHYTIIFTVVLIGLIYIYSVQSQTLIEGFSDKKCGSKEITDLLSSISTKDLLDLAEIIKKEHGNLDIMKNIPELYDNFQNSSTLTC